MRKLGIRDIENSMECLFKKNLGDRNNNLLGMLKLIDNIDDNLVLAIDGSWGTGKTIFVKQLEYLIKQVNVREHEGVLKKYLGEDTNYEIKNDYITVYYDAWENDDCENPFESLLYSIAQSFGKKKSERNKNIGGKFLDVLKCFSISIGGGVIPTSVSASGVDIAKAMKSEDVLEEFLKKEQVKVALKRALESLSEENEKTKIIIFIDEVDRCKPTFAMELLEKIKHLFDDKKIIFVFSTNLNQLEKTVKKYYGESFAAYEYLDKIFDLRLGLNEIKVEEYIKFLLKENESFNARDMNEYLGELVRYFGFGLRQCERYALQMKIVDKYMDSIPNRYKNEQDEKGKIFLFLPIVLGMKLKGTNQYKNFLKGENLKEFMLLIEECFYGHKMMKDFIEINESGVGSLEAIGDFYQRTFNDKQIAKSGERDCANCKDEIVRTISLLNSNAEYSI